MYILIISWYVGTHENLNIHNSGAGIIHPSGAPEFLPVLGGIRVAQCLDFCVNQCLSFCHFSFVLSVLRIMASDYPFVILEL